MHELRRAAATWAQVPRLRLDAALTKTADNSELPYGVNA